MATSEIWCSSIFLNDFLYFVISSTEILLIVSNSLRNYLIYFDFQMSFSKNEFGVFILFYYISVEILYEFY